MKTFETTNDVFKDRITQAADHLRCCDFETAYDLITQAMHIEPDAPQPHNLLGIWFELRGDGDKARRHYRAAYSLDPTFAPACKNLEQISTAFDNKIPRTYDFGDQTEETSRRETEKHSHKNYL